MCALGSRNAPFKNEKTLEFPISPLQLHREKLVWKPLKVLRMDRLLKILIVSSKQKHVNVRDCDRPWPYQVLWAIFTGRRSHFGKEIENGFHCRYLFVHVRFVRPIKKLKEFYYLKWSSLAWNSRFFFHISDTSSLFSLKEKNVFTEKTSFFGSFLHKTSMNSLFGSPHQLLANMTNESYSVLAVGKRSAIFVDALNHTPAGSCFLKSYGTRAVPLMQVSGNAWP